MPSDTKQFTVTNIGPFAKIELGPDNKFSKQFLKEQLQLTGMEISVTNLPKGKAVPFFHSHKQNEELYIVVAGRGQIQLGNEILELQEGSFVSVLPAAPRCLRAAPDSNLVYLCIQAKENSLEQYTKGDGVRNEDVSWTN